MSQGSHDAARRTALSTAMAFRVRRGPLAAACLATLALVASLSAGTRTAGAAVGDCPNEAARHQQAATHLPSCRAYELVSPEHQGFPTGAGPTAAGSNMRVWVAPGGEWIAYPSFDPFVGVSGLPGTFRGTRGAAGWENTGLFPVASEGMLLQNVLAVAVSDDGEKILLESAPSLLPSDTDTANDLYLNDPNTGLTLVTAGTPDSAFYEGRSGDLSHVVFATVGNLVPEASGSALKLYEWVEGSIRLVGIKPDGSVDPGGSILGRREEGTTNNSLPVNAVTADGSSIVFTSPAPSKSVAGNRTKVYVRVDGTETIHASASKCTRVDCNAEQNVHYAGASGDGSTVFLMTTQQLTDDDVDTKNDLYAFDTESLTLTRLSGGPGLPLTSVNNSPVLGSSSDGQVAYIRLAGSMLGVSDHGTLTQIGTVDSSTAGGDQNCQQSTALGVPQATPNGDTFVVSTPTFTPVNPERPSGAGIYRYQASTGTLTKISTSGSLPHGGAASTDLDCALRKGISDDGNRIFFTTSQALIPQDVNGVNDVYAWEGGQLAIVSSGVDEQISNLLGVSADGRDVFFTSSAALAPQDRDTVQDVYDARVDGGFPAPTPQTPCQGEACHGAPAPTAAGVATATASFSGDGNVETKHVTRCAQNRRKVRRKGKTRCLPRKSSRRRAAKNTTRSHG